ncbi:uncharacterized protein LOC105696745 isoform X2 [Orussus abietinus]|uniref:uncharacterized protein LOC105696745 isoform X2 n=1 Tax=Orussus abietinus TaxID=222816 RepID=UPI000C715C8F|nr:uncharacterized protein LOC105696745 isoform X2 [Orussus abietinus]
MPRTPGGCSLSRQPQVVVFESKKVSVLVADPRHTKVNVKAEISRPGIDLPSSNLDYPDPELPPSTAEYLQTQEKSRNEQEYRPRTQPYRVKVHQVEMEQNQTQSNPVRGPSASEVPLSSLGFTGEQPIDWNNIILPEKTDLYQELARRITNYKNADCIVRIGQDEFHCHLLVLQSYSTFFDEKNCKDVDLSGSSVTSRAFSIIYDWMISPTVESCHLLRRDNILEIFMAAQYLGIKELEEQCWAFIDNDELFSEDTAFLLYLEARKIGNTAVMELMVPRIMKFFLMLVGTKDFLELSVEELCLLLRSNYICVNSEMDVLMSAVRWLMFDWDGRKQYLLDVLKCVRFGLIAPWQLVDVKRNPENPEFMELMSYPEVQKMVDDGLAFVIIKYWYGNQTEDYYHWIDLLGLTEPTNRNWAGEDKSYVTYREFLLYLEDYQRTKLPELKLRKSRGKPAPPNSPPKESPSPPPTRGRGNYFQNHGNMEAAASGQGVPSNASRNTKQPMKGQSSPYVSNGGPGGAMSPEILSEYLSNLDRGSKGGQRMAGDGELANKPGNLEARLGGGGGETLKKIYNITKSGRAFELYRPEERPSVPDSHDGGGNSKAIQETRYYQQWETNVTAKRHNDVSAHRHRWDPSLNRRSGSNRRKDPKARSSDERTESAKSEEEAATMIQATYRGYKVRRKFDEIRKTSSEEKRNAKRMAEFLSIPAGQNLPKPLEPVKVSNGSIGRERTSKERTQSPRKKIRDSSKARAKRDLRQVDDDQCSSAKDLEGLRFEVCKPQPTPRTQKLAKPADSTLMTAPTNPVETSKPIQTIKSPAFFQNCDERMSYLSPSDNTDTDDPFSPRMGERSPVDLQTRDIARGYPKLDPNYEEGKIYRATSAFQPRPRTRDIPPQTKFKRPATQKMGANVLIDGPYSENSLFHPGRESVLIFGGMDPHKLCGCTGNTGRDIYRFKPSDNVWEFIGEIPEPRHHHSVVYLRGRVYLVGGADPREDDLERKNVVVGTVWSYDPCSRVWFEEPGLLTPRKNFGLIVSHGKMFAMGGQDKNGIALRSVEAFDPVESTWREVQPMYTARMGPASAKYQDLIWVAGGMTKSKKEPISKDVECYDPLKNLWLKVEPLKSPRCFASMHVVAESLYVIGGASKISENVTESIDTIDVWDPKSCSWKLQTEMAVPRHGHSTGSIGNQLLIIGGVTTMYMRTLKSVECYSCELAKWITGVSSLPHAVSGHGSVSLPPTNVLKDY